MKKIVKKISLFVLFLLCFFSFSLCFACSGQVTFKDFEDQTVEVTLGQNYLLEVFPILGSDNKYYQVEAEVSDKDGNKVETIGNILKVNDFGGYTVVYTVLNQKRTVTLNVKTTSKPNVVIEDCKTTYKIGEKFVFPQIKIFDKVDKNLAPTITVINSAGEEISFDKENNCFDCTVAGEYGIKVSVTNSNNLTDEKIFKFFVRTPALSGEIDTFNERASFEIVETNKGVRNAEWLDTAYGRDGVLKLEVARNDQYTGIFKFEPKQGYEEYVKTYKNNPEDPNETEKYRNSYYVATMFIEAPVGSVKELQLQKYITSLRDIKYNMWFDYTVNAHSLISSLNQNGALLEDDPKKLSIKDVFGYVYATFTSDVTIYVDKLSFVESKTAVTCENSLKGATYNCGQTVNFADLIKAEDGEKLFYTILIDGKPVGYTYDQFTFEYASKNYTVMASVDQTNKVADECKYNFSVKGSDSASFNNFTTYIDKETQLILPTLIITDASENDVTSNYEITSKIDFISNAGIREENVVFSKARSGSVEFELTAEHKVTHEKHRKTAVMRIGPYLANEIIDVDRADAKILFASQGSMSVIPNGFKDVKNPNDYQGANVLSIERKVPDASNQNLKISFKPVHSADYYDENYEMAYFPIRVKSNDQSITHFNVKILGLNYTVESDKWQTLNVPISAITSSMNAGKLYPLVTWSDWSILITPDGGNIVDKTITVYMGSIMAGNLEMGQKLFSATSESVNSLSINKSTGSNVLLTKEQINALNLSGEYNGENAVQMEFNHGSAYMLNGIPNSYVNKILAYKSVSFNIAILKPQDQALDANAIVMFNNGTQALEDKDKMTYNLLFSKYNGFMNFIFGDGVTDRQYNEWQKLTVSTETFVKMLSGGDLKLFVLYTNKLTEDNKLNMKVLIGDVTLEGAREIGDEYVDESFFE